MEMFHVFGASSFLVRVLTEFKSHLKFQKIIMLKIYHIFINKRTRPFFLLRPGAIIRRYLDGEFQGQDKLGPEKVCLELCLQKKAYYFEPCLQKKLIIT